MEGLDLRRCTLVALGVLLLWQSTQLSGHQDHEHAAMDEEVATGKYRAPADPSGGGSRWGANYFPNVPLITHEGKTVLFFDDVIKDKVVVINFIYTSCTDSCPLETARLVNLQNILGDRVGEDVFMYSITIDPERDTPEVLKQYREKFKVGPGWLFLTGNKEDIVLLRRKLGLYIEDIQDENSNDHNLSLIIGNQSTGRWIKRSPFEDPYFLASQVGSWLHNWKRPPVNQKSYAEAEQLRNMTKGEDIFRGRCTTCHTIGGGHIRDVAKGTLGPDLEDVTRTRDRAWLERWLENPDKMLAEKDPIAMALYAEYDNVPMPNMYLSKGEVDDLIEFMEAESGRVKKRRQAAVSSN